MCIQVGCRHVECIQVTCRQVVCRQVDSYKSCCPCLVYSSACIGRRQQPPNRQYWYSCGSKLLHLANFDSNKCSHTAVAAKAKQNDGNTASHLLSCCDPNVLLVLIDNVLSSNILVMERRMFTAVSLESGDINSS